MVLYSALTFSLMVVSLCEAAFTITSPACSLTIRNQINNIDDYVIAQLDRRDYVEYHVTYFNDLKEKVPFEETNTTRFQPLRWFNVHNDIKSVLPVTYDYLFNIFKWVFYIHMEYVDINVTPLNCIYTLDFETIEELTRALFLNVSGALINSHICSAHIDNHDGEGSLSFKCCAGESSKDLKCHTINETFKWQKGLHIISIVASISILLFVFFCIFSNSSIGSEEFIFHPNSNTYISKNNSIEGIPPPEEENLHSQKDTLEILKEAEETQLLLKHIINLSKKTIVAARHIIQLIKNITMFKEIDRKLVRQIREYQIKKKSLVRNVKQAIQRLIEQEQRFMTESSNVQTMSKLNEIVDNVYKISDEIKEAAGIVLEASKKNKNPWGAYPIVKIFDGFKAVEASEKAHRDAKKTLADFSNVTMAFRESIRNVEELKEEANKDVHKKLNDDKENTLQAAMAIEIQVKTAITLAGHAASKTKELSLEQMQKITIRENEKIITNPIRLLVLKEKCVDENNLALTFIRCLTEFLTGLNKSFFKVRDEEKKCCGMNCEWKWVWKCEDNSRLYIGRLLSIFCSAIVLTPLILIEYKYYNGNKDYKKLCKAYGDKGYTCLLMSKKYRKN